MLPIVFSLHVVLVYMQMHNRWLYEELVSKTSYIQSDMLLIFIIDLYGN